MTVLARYQRLEALGLWRADEDAQRREVVVSIGEATLTLTELNGRVVTQWSLPALRRANPGRRPAIFTLDGFESETLEIADPDMIDALEAVMATLTEAPRGPGRLRASVVAATLGAVALAVVLWLPDAIAGYVARVAPPGVRAGLTQHVLTEVQSLTGRACDAPAGRRALSRLQARVFPSGDLRLAVLPSVLGDARLLPGDLMVIGRGLVEDHETPEVVAAHLAAERLRHAGADPLRTYLRDLGFVASVRLLTTGRIDSDSVSDWAARRLVAPQDAVDDEALLRELDALGIAARPYGQALDITGETTRPFLEAPPLAALRPVLEDGDWLALQRICEDRG